MNGFPVRMNGERVTATLSRVVAGLGWADDTCLISVIPANGKIKNGRLLCCCNSCAIVQRKRGIIRDLERLILRSRTILDNAIT